jgi:hypothetical protein
VQDNFWREILLEMAQIPSDSEDNDNKNTSDPVHSRFQDIGAELRKKHGSCTVLVEAAKNSRQIYVPVILPSTEKSHERALRLWRSYWLSKLQTPEPINRIMAPGAPFPPLAEFIFMIKHLATLGSSRLSVPGVTGWSMKTTQKITSRIIGAVSFHEVLLPAAATHTLLY